LKTPQIEAKTLIKHLTLLLLCFSTSTLPAAKVEPGAIQAYFSPKDQIAKRLIALIEKEQKSIYLAVYCFSHRGISEALIQAKRRGVQVEVIVDPFSVKTRFPLGRLARSDIPVFVWNPPMPSPHGEKPQKKQPLMHDKFCIFGGSGVWTGSFNFTYDADLKNRENVLFFEDAEIAKSYLDHFKAMKHKGCPPYEEYLTAHVKPKKARRVRSHT
jgi:phosphatidylserine/phosphatidylglycerophosphate/cardiolipin synthase-like enzyme